MNARGVLVDIYGESVMVHDSVLARDISRFGMEVTGPAEKTGSDNPFHLQAGEKIVAIDEAWVSADLDANRRLLERGSKIKSVGVVEASSTRLEIRTVGVAVKP
jgi:hypothetical protein